MGETEPPRTSLDVLRERLDKNIETCGNRSEFFAAKRALIEEIERRLGTETDPSKLADLRELHRRYSGKLPSECPPPPEAPKAGPTGALPSAGSPLDAVAAVAQDRRARLAKRASVLLNIYYLASLIPKAGIGVRRDGAPGAAPEKSAGETPRRANGLGISAGFQTKIASDIDLRLRGEYGKGDGVSDVAAPATSVSQRVDTGAVYGRLSNGSSGIIAGFGGTGRAMVELEQWGLGTEVGWKVAGSSGSPIEVRITAGVDYGHIIRDYDMSIASSGSASGVTFSFDQTRNQRLEEDYLGLTLGVQIDFELCEDLDLQGSAKGGPFHVDTRFLGTERNTANFGPAPNRDFTLEFNEKDGRWGGRFEAGAGMEYRVSDRLSITGRVRYEYRSDVGAIDNPNSGDQVFFEGKTSGLSSQDWSAWDAGVGLKLRF
jgi:opacity protein-like surface antigen